MWDPYQKLRSALAKTEDTSFIRVFVNGDEVEGIDDVPRRTSENTHVVAYSENYEFYRQYLSWADSTPSIHTVKHTNDPKKDVDVNPLRRSGEMSPIRRSTSYLQTHGDTA